MKQAVKIIPAGLILVLNSCTFPKWDCTEASSDMIHTIGFNNFSQHDLDSIILTSYTIKSNFTSAVDSYVIHGNQYDTLKFYAETSLINIKLDYKIVIVNTRQIFKLTGFATKRVICDKSLFNETYFNELASYYVNGQKKIDNFIEVDK
jgi:hypothetical protein